MNDQAVTFVQVSANEVVIQPKSKETPKEEKPPKKKMPQIRHPFPLKTCIVPLTSKQNLMSS